MIHDISHIYRPILCCCATRLGVARLTKMATWCRRGDEYHILSECKNTSVMNYRISYQPKDFVNWLSVFKLILLLQSNKPKVISKLGAFLKNVLPLFKSLLLRLDQATCCCYILLLLYVRMRINFTVHWRETCLGHSATQRPITSIRPSKT